MTSGWHDDQVLIHRMPARWLGSRREERAFRVVAYGGALLLLALFLVLPVNRVGILIVIPSSLLYLVAVGAVRARASPQRATRPRSDGASGAPPAPSLRAAFRDVRAGRARAVAAAIMALAAGAWFVARIHVLLLLVYLPVAVVLFALADAVVIQRIFPLKRGRDEVARLLEAILDGRGTESDWRSLVMLRMEDPQLEAIRGRLLAVAMRDPARREAIARECLEQLREGAA